MFRKRTIQVKFSARIAVMAIAAVLGSTAVKAQNVDNARPANMMAGDAHPTFDVATIRPSDPDSRGASGLSVEGNRIVYTNQTLEQLILIAYGLQEQQLVGAPAWLGTEKYDIDGVPDTEGRPDLSQMQEMYRKLLAERLNLKVHMEKRDLAVYALALGKGAPKINKSQGDPNGLPTLNFKPTPQLMTLKVANATMSDFLLQMQMLLSRPLVDQTGLKGRFDFTLKWTPDDSQLNDLGMQSLATADSASSQPGLFTAVQEQLGLKLDAVKAPADVLVIDKIDRPSAN